VARARTHTHARTHGPARADGAVYQASGGANEEPTHNAPTCAHQTYRACGGWEEDGGGKRGGSAPWRRCQGRRRTGQRQDPGKTHHPRKCGGAAPSTAGRWPCPRCDRRTRRKTRRNARVPPSEHTLANTCTFHTQVQEHNGAVRQTPTPTAIVHTTGSKRSGRGNGWGRGWGGGVGVRGGWGGGWGVGVGQPRTAQSTSGIAVVRSSMVLRVPHSSAMPYRKPSLVPHKHT
jgi:hypothetical protein